MHIQRYHCWHHTPTAAAGVTRPPSPSRAGCGFPAPDQTPRQVCGWCNLVATSPTACQVGSKRPGRGQTQQGTENRRCHSRGFSKHGARKKRAESEDHTPCLRGPRFPASQPPAPSPQPQLGTPGTNRPRLQQACSQSRSSEEEFQMCKYRGRGGYLSLREGDFAHETHCVCHMVATAEENRSQDTVFP